MTKKEEVIQRLKELILSQRRRSLLVADYQEAQDRHTAIYRQHDKKSFKKLHPDHQLEIQREYQKVCSLGDHCRGACDAHIKKQEEFHEFISENASEILEINEEKKEQKVVKKLGSVKPSLADEMYEKFMEKNS